MGRLVLEQVWDITITPRNLPAGEAPILIDVQFVYCV
jgi:hypothetical protein